MIDFACQEFQVEEIIKCSLGLTRSECRVFTHFFRKGAGWSTAEDVAERLELDVSTVQRALKKLSERGVVERHQENLDRGGYVFVYRSAPKPEVRDVIVQILREWTKGAEEHVRSW